MKKPRPKLHCFWLEFLLIALIILCVWGQTYANQLQRDATLWDELQIEQSFVIPTTW